MLDESPERPHLTMGALLRLWLTGFPFIHGGDISEDDLCVAQGILGGGLACLRDRPGTVMRLACAGNHPAHARGRRFRQQRGNLSGMGLRHLCRRLPGLPFHVMGGISAQASACASVPPCGGVSPPKWRKDRPPRGLDGRIERAYRFLHLKYCTATRTMMTHVEYINGFIVNLYVYSSSGFSMC